ncbi:MAG: tetratricopeptide repeat protein [Terriglobales bacterium]
MSETNTEQSQSLTNSGRTAAGWTGTQAYILAVFCLVLGVALGYLFRGSASTAAATLTAGQQQGSEPQKQPPSADAQAALAQAAAPLLDAVNRNPTDYESLVKLGNLFYDGQQFPSAIQYYERALAIHPEDPDVRTDMGTAYWYTGNAEKALAAMEASLKYRPGHPQTLFNLGWVRWQGKADPKGAIEAWQQLLKANPDYPQKQ